MNELLRIITGCEYSQIVTKAFRAKGHEAYSCDIIPCEGGHPEWHYQEDILEVLKREKFDLGIFHPPCTYLSYAGEKALKENPERINLRIEAMNFFKELYNSKIDKICIENPQGVPIKWKPPTQRINPFDFGDPIRKRILLWLKNLPPLVMGVLNPAGIEPEKYYIRKSGSRKGGRYGRYFMTQKRGQHDRSIKEGSMIDQSFSPE